MEGNVWTRERIEEELRDYRQVKCSVDMIRLEIEELEDYLKNRDEVIEGEVLQRPINADVVHGGRKADSTCRVATGATDEEVELSLRRINLRRLERRVRRVEAWLAALPNRQRTIIKMMYIDGMVWGEIVMAYNARPTDGAPRPMNTLRNWKNAGMNMIETLANQELVANRSQIGHVHGKTGVV